MNTKHFAFASLSLILLAACGTEKEYRADDFGASVRNMIELQSANPQAAANPPAGIRGPMNGEKAASSMDTYRKGYGPAGAPESTPQTPAATFSLMSSSSASTSQ